MNDLHVTVSSKKHFENWKQKKKQLEFFIMYLCSTYETVLLVKTKSSRDEIVSYSKFSWWQTQ